MSEKKTADHEDGNGRYWRGYVCAKCGGIVVAASEVQAGPITEMYPGSTAVSEALPKKVREFLRQAHDSLHAPAGAIMLAASAVDEMLKEKGYKGGNLYNRIDKAADDNVITQEMAQWAHQVRLDANDQRHADDDADMPASKEAKLTVNFAEALGEFLFVLPSLVTQGIEESDTTDKDDPDEGPH